MTGDHGLGEVPLADFGAGINSSSSFSESSLMLIMAALLHSLCGKEEGEGEGEGGEEEREIYRTSGRKMIRVL